MREHDDQSRREKAPPSQRTRTVVGLLGVTAGVVFAAASLLLGRSGRRS